MKILAYTSPARGHLYPLVPILDELARRGHDVSLRTLASQVPRHRSRRPSRRSSTTTTAAGRQ